MSESLKYSFKNATPEWFCCGGTNVDIVILCLNCELLNINLLFIDLLYKSNIIKTI